MSLVAAYIVPHPPLAVPEVGHGEETKIQATLDGYAAVAKRIASLAPETILIISPHTAYYADWIYLAGGKDADGNLASFRAPMVQLHLTYDELLRSTIEELAQAKNLPAGVIPARQAGLDHGMMVPLSFIEKAYPTDRFDAVSIGGAGVSREDLIAFGRCIAQAAQVLERRCVLLVSGDLSHKLKEEGPYGFHPAGPEFDAAFVRVVESGDPLAFAELDAHICEDAAECGLSGFIMMAGALNEVQKQSGLAFTSQLLSYEGPFGVGYGIAAFEREDNLSFGFDGEEAEVLADDTEPSKRSDADADSGEVLSTTSAHESKDPLVRLARTTIETYIKDGRVIKPAELPADVPARAGCFVSIHTAETDELRGCIGTIEPVERTLAEEIIANAISAATKDPRFPPIMAHELPNLSISVDVLFEPEPALMEDLDPQRYGVIVTQGYRRGLLLPDLEGVDRVEDQVNIACRKAGIDPSGVPDQVQLERFEVVRHV